jgi:hypothetical protein
MSHDLDPLHRALADLAATVDHEQGADRWDAVQALARRRAHRRRAGLALAGLCLVTAAGLGVSRLTSHHDVRTQLPADQTPRSVSTVAVPSASSVPVASATSAAVPGSPTASVAPVAWLNRTYPVTCGEHDGPLAFTDGRAALVGLDVKATVSSEEIVEQDTKVVVPVEIVVIGCLEADSNPGAVLVYRRFGDHALLGTPVNAGSRTEVFDTKVVEGKLVISAWGWSRVPGAPDRMVTTTAALTSSGMTTTVTTEPVTGPSRQWAYLNVAPVLTSADGSRDVAFTADVTGLVPRLYDTTGNPLPTKGIEVLGTQVTWGDGRTDGSDAGAVTCKDGAALTDLHNTFHEQHTYAEPGRYTITFETGACPPVGRVTRTLTVVVR